MRYTVIPKNCKPEIVMTAFKNLDIPLFCNNITLQASSLLVPNQGPFNVGRPDHRIVNEHYLSRLKRMVHQVSNMDFKTMTCGAGGYICLHQPMINPKWAVIIEVLFIKAWSNRGLMA